jgi:hypothetical protein
VFEGRGGGVVCGVAGGRLSTGVEKKMGQNLVLLLIYMEKCVSLYVN